MFVSVLQQRANLLSLTMLLSRSAAGLPCFCQVDLGLRYVEDASLYTFVKHLRGGSCELALGGWVAAEWLNVTIKFNSFHASSFTMTHSFQYNIYMFLL